MGCPERYRPVVAFSILINSCGVNSGIAGSGISFVAGCFAFPADMEKKSICPSKFSRCCAATESIMLS